MRPALEIHGRLEARGASGALTVVGHDDHLVIDLPRLSDGLLLLTAGHRSGRRALTGASRLVNLISALRRTALRLELRCRGHRFATVGSGSLPLAVHGFGLVRVMLGRVAGRG